VSGVKPHQQSQRTEKYYFITLNNKNIVTVKETCFICDCSSYIASSSSYIFLCLISKQCQTHCST
jgi:hypothetical protein